MTSILRRLGAFIGLATGLTGCIGVSYYAQSVDGHLKIMSARRNVDEMITNPSTPPALRGRLETASAVRTFASGELDLPDNRSYRDYVDVGRNYVTLAVYAAPEFSLQPQLWCFAVFGCVPYKGYFSEKSAKAEVDKLKQRGLDVHVSGVIAYSTLGWMSDPLLNTMLGEDDNYLASLQFHELAHQRVYIEGDSAFNEAFAVAVETTGLEKWLRSTGNAAGLRRYRQERKRQADFLALVAETSGELGRIYASSDPVETKRAEKAAAIERLRQRYRRMRDERWGGYRGYDGWFDAPINNAKLAAAAVYNDRVPEFLRLFALCAGNYPRFYNAVRRIGNVDRTVRTEALASVKTCD